VRVFYNESAALPPARLQEIVTDRASYEESIRQVIRDGQAAGVFAPHLDPSLTGIAILAILNSVIQWFRPDGARSLDEIIDVFTDLILRSVANPPDPSPHHPKEQP
jgi:TetR/AcrR family transcriptional regulator, cholesterol catabolism regulator